MSRFDDYDFEEDFPNQSELWQQAARNALRGQRGQAVLHELRAALLALPTKRLISGALCQDGGVCALGAYAAYKAVSYGLSYREATRLLEITGGDDYDGRPYLWAPRLGIAESLAWTVGWQNDEGGWQETPEQRYERLLHWVESEILEG